MLRPILTAVALVELLAPKALIETAERVALTDPQACELRPWVVPGARFEGLVLLASMWRSDASYSRLKRLLGLVGVVALVAPRTYVDTAAPLAYTDASDCDWRPWVYPGTRLVGLLYVLVALNEVASARRADADEP